MRKSSKDVSQSPFQAPLQNCGRPLWVTGGKTPSEYIFSELTQVADIARSAFFHDLASPLVSQITAFWVQAIPGEL